MLDSVGSSKVRCKKLENQTIPQPRARTITIKKANKGQEAPVGQNCYRVWLLEWFKSATNFRDSSSSSPLPSKSKSPHRPFSWPLRNKSKSTISLSDVAQIMSEAEDDDDRGTCNVDDVAKHATVITIECSSQDRSETIFSMRSFTSCSDQLDDDMLWPCSPCAKPSPKRIPDRLPRSRVVAIFSN